MKSLLFLWIGLVLLVAFPSALPAQEDYKLTPEDYERLTPEAYWSFNSCRARSRVRDSSPGQHHLTRKGARCVGGKYGLGLGLKRGSFTAETEADVLNLTDQVTLAAWVNPRRVSGTQAVVHKGFAPDSYGLFIVDGTIVFSVTFIGGVTHTVAAPLTQRQWTHVTGVFDGAAKSIKIYINGIKRGEKTFGEEPPLQQSTRPVVIGGQGFRGRVDEVGLYDAAFTNDEIKNLAGRDKAYYFGADTFTYPGWLRGTFIGDGFSPEEIGYDFYLGRLGESRRLCRIRTSEPRPRDVLTWDADAPNCCFDEKGCTTRSDSEKCPCAFVYDAALITRPERTYGYWLVAGPDHVDARRYKRPGLDLSLFGWIQASRANRQWRTYKHLVGGRTLFADLERCIDCTFESDTSGWARCEPVESRPNACKDNRAVLEGFLRGVAGVGFTPGVYTRAGIWEEFFGKDYVPGQESGEPIPFVLWLTGYYKMTKGSRPHTVTEVKEILPTAEQQALGGMGTVLWQHHINRPDWDATRQNPSRGFEPQPAPGTDPDPNPNPDARLTPVAVIQINEGNPSTGAFGPEYRFTVDHREGEYAYSVLGFLWSLEHGQDLTPGEEYLHVVVKRINGPGPANRIEGEECACDCPYESYSPCYWQNDGPGGGDIGNGETIDIGGVAPLLSFDAQLDGAQFVIEVYHSPFGGNPPGVYEFEIQEIYSVDVNSGQKTVLWRKP